MVRRNEEVTNWITWNSSTPSIITLSLLVLFGCCSNQILNVAAEGNIGCLFVESMCLDNVEWCFDDYAFGKCLPKYGFQQDEMERAPLNEEQSHILSTMLEELQGAGLGWDHQFVQCRMQGALFSLRNSVPMPPTLCANMAPDPEILEPQSPLAFVRFSPPNDDYADEIYYPPVVKKGFDDRLYMQPLKTIQPLDKFTSSSSQSALSSSSSLPSSSSAAAVSPAETAPGINRQYGLDGGYVGYNSFGQRFQPSKRRGQNTAELDFNNNDEINDLPGSSSFGSGTGNVDNTLANRLKDIRNRIELRQMLAEYEAGNLKPPNYYTDPNGVEGFYGDDPAAGVFIQNYGGRGENNMEFLEQQNNLKRNGNNNFDEITNEIPAKTAFREISRQQQHYQEPTHNNMHHKHLHEFEETNQLPLEPLKLSGSSMNSHEISSPESGVYTEGGLVYVPDTESQDHNSFERKLEATTLLANMLGFTRHERLDVKKPGPPAAPPPSSQSPHEPPSVSANQETNSSTVKDGNKEVVPNHFKDGAQPKIKKLLHTDEDHGPHSVDTEYTHVILKTPIENWGDGRRIVAALAETLNMQNYLTFSRVDRHEISFRVEPNPEKKTAADIARAINDSRIKNNLSRRFGVVVIRAGVGDKTKEPLSVSISKVDAAAEGPDVTHVMAYMFAGAGAAAVIVIVITLFLIRRHDQKRDKLGGLQAGLAGTETSSKDYQELCRARMAGKGNSNDTVPSGRIASICKENDRPPSSRSSTSSWSEEPAITNMDISTGHMVLSYMEDHLRNKGRLQREWEALCRYEAEPGSREAAIQPQCEPLNRPTAPLPYDHSRLVINHLTNAEGLDYINASTITDHDPRAPAYVAAQGPLPSTLAHFWQMIWEQGSVVIVSLCRLQENGEIACARYWPEEGSEVYHIYEVHLVSEHIWCDDYLVRSFYLKNLRTSETRTVTQFHFLSWPSGGVPVAAKALLEFRRKVNKSYRGRSCPVVVHSSNGAGRTGAYILLDLVLARMNKGAREIDIAATLEHLRDQRAGLVATRQQFEFVLMAVAEEVHAILKALPATTQPEKRELDNETVKEQPSGINSSSGGGGGGGDEKDQEKEKLIDKKEESTSSKTSSKSPTTSTASTLPPDTPKKESMEKNK